MDVTINNIRKEFGQFPALHDVSLSVGTGELIALLGPSGSGKTTLVLHLNGLIEAQVGTIVVGGVAVDAPHLSEIRRSVGMVFQDPEDQLFMHTVLDDVAFGPANLGIRG